MSKQVNNIDDFGQMLSDMEVVLLQTSLTEIEITFPENEEEKKYDPKKTDELNSVMYPIPPGMTIDNKDNIVMSRSTRNYIRNLVSSPRFWRCTGVAHHVASFGFKTVKNMELQKKYGIIKSRKKAKENLTMIFESSKFLNNFVKDIKEHFKESEVALELLFQGNNFE